MRKRKQLAQYTHGLKLSTKLSKINEMWVSLLVEYDAVDDNAEEEVDEGSD